MKNNPCHRDKLVALKRIEGQVRGLQKMIEDERYCIDILIQISSVVGALLRVKDNIMERHLQLCITDTLKGKSVAEKEIKISEIIDIIKKFRKSL